MSTITSDSLSAAVYKVGDYVQADGRTGMPEAYIVPNIPVSLTGQHRVASANNNTADKNKHFRQGFYPFSFRAERDTTKKLVTNDVDVYKLNFRLPDTTKKIIFLPFFDKNITSTKIPLNDNSVCYFITDVLSGCSFYIDQLPGARGDLICYHANAIHSPTDAANVMDTQHNTARTEAYPTAVNKFSLRKDRYYAEALKVENEAKRKAKSGTNVQFAGGTMVMGFLVNGRWEFWFQTYGRLVKTSPSTSLLGKPKEDKIKYEVETIINRELFWKEGQ